MSSEEFHNAREEQFLGLETAAYRLRFSLDNDAANHFDGIEILDASQRLNSPETRRLFF